MLFGIFPDLTALKIAGDRPTVSSMAAYQTPASTDRFFVAPATNATTGIVLVALAGIMFTVMAMMRLPHVTIGLIGGPAIVAAATRFFLRERQIFVR